MKCLKSQDFGKFGAVRMKFPKAPFFMHVGFRTSEHPAITLGFRITQL
jgi:hypothetical protein